MSERITTGDEHLEGNIGNLVSSTESKLTMPESNKLKVLSALLRGAAAATPVAEPEATLGPTATQDLTRLGDRPSKAQE